MKINGLNGANTQIGGMNMKATDSVSKNIQNQIANAQKQLQDISGNKDMSIEEKMQKRQEVLQEITDLNNQLRQHQMEMRKEKQQAKGSSMNDMLGGGGRLGVLGVLACSVHSIYSALHSIDGCGSEDIRQNKKEKRRGLTSSFCLS